MVDTPGAYVPERGDPVWINLHPQAGHEQAGRRPAVVLSPSAYNRRVGLALFWPITNQRKGYPFEVHIPPRLRVTGVVLADQLKSLNRTTEHWYTRMVAALRSQVCNRTRLSQSRGD